ncbi:MAG: hypothetical protein JJE25_08825 [Bacteroidia bacterium]|nr:hypothetical protein [Bacteroidia bacterium]
MKAKNIALLVLLIIFLGNLIRTGGLNDIRTVDFLQILATGACVGVILVNLFSRSKIKS